MSIYYITFFRKTLIFLVAFSAAVPLVFAQDTRNERDDVFQRPLDDLIVVGSMGIAGGVIGLSTLSFGGKSRQNLRYIVSGISLGIISGLGWVAYNQAMTSRDDYGDLDFQEMASFYKAAPSPSALMITWNWQF